jgi:hypothetical protein
MTNKLSKTREDLRTLAERTGWTLAENRAWSDTFHASVQLPPDHKLRIIADLQGFRLTEDIRVTYNYLGAITSATFQTPRDQAALNGQYVSTSDSVGPRDRNKKSTVETWMLMTRNY